MRHFYAFLAAFVSALMMSQMANAASPRAHVFIKPEMVCDAEKCQLQMTLVYPEGFQFPIKPWFDFNATDCENNTIATFRVNYEMAFPGTQQTKAVWSDFPPIEEDRVYSFGVWMTQKMDSDFNKNGSNAHLVLKIVDGEEKFGLPVWWSGCYQRNN